MLEARTTTSMGTDTRSMLGNQQQTQQQPPAQPFAPVYMIRVNKSVNGVALMTELTCDEAAYQQMLQCGNICGVVIRTVESQLEHLRHTFLAGQQPPINPNH